MKIDSCSKVHGGSDHRSIFFEMESIVIAEMHEEEREQNVKGPSETTADE